MFDARKKQYQINVTKNVDANRNDSTNSLNFFASKMKNQNEATEFIRNKLKMQIRLIVRGKRADDVGGFKTPKNRR